MTSINAANCWQCYDRVQDQNIWSPGYQWWTKNFVWWHISYSAFWALTISPSHLWDRGTTSTEVKFNNKPLLNLIFFLLILYLVCGYLQWYNRKQQNLNVNWSAQPQQSIRKYCFTFYREPEYFSSHQISKQFSIPTADSEPLKLFTLYDAVFRSLTEKGRSFWVWLTWDGCKLSTGSTSCQTGFPCCFQSHITLCTGLSK